MYIYVGHSEGLESARCDQMLLYVHLTGPGRIYGFMVYGFSQLLGVVYVFSLTKAGSPGFEFCVTFDR